MKEKILLWAYRTFMYFVPSGVALYTFLFSKLLDKDVSVMGKLGVSGIFILILIAVIGIFFFGKHLRKKKELLRDQIAECIDIHKKKELIAKKKKIDAIQEIFHNIIFITPFVITYFLILMVEKQAISIRGTLFYVVMSMMTGLGLNGYKEWVEIKNKQKG